MLLEINHYNINYLCMYLIRYKKNRMKIIGKGSL